MGGSLVPPMTPAAEDLLGQGIVPPQTPHLGLEHLEGLHHLPAMENMGYDQVCDFCGRFASPFAQRPLAFNFHYIVWWQYK